MCLLWRHLGRSYLDSGYQEKAKLLTELWSALEKSLSQIILGAVSRSKVRCQRSVFSCFHMQLWWCKPLFTIRTQPRAAWVWKILPKWSRESTHRKILRCHSSRRYMILLNGSLLLSMRMKTPGSSRKLRPLLHTRESKNCSRKWVWVSYKEAKIRFSRKATSTFCQSKIQSQLSLSLKTSGLPIWVPFPLFSKKLMIRILRHYVLRDSLTLSKSVATSIWRMREMLLLHLLPSSHR